MVLMKDREDERLFLRTKLFSSIRRRDEGVSAEQNGSWETIWVCRHVGVDEVSLMKKGFGIFAHAEQGTTETVDL